MTQKDLKYLVAESIGAQSENKEIVFRILTKKIANQLQPGEAVRIKNVGTFNKPKDESSFGEETISSVNRLIFVPIGGESDQAANSLFTSIRIASQKESGEFSAENIFEVGVSKPITSIRNPGEVPGESISLKEIDKKVDELLDSSEKIEEYSIWSRPIEEVAADEISEDENIFSETDDISDESASDAGILTVSGLAAGEINDVDESLALPDFESMEKDFISEIKTSESNEKIHIVSEDDIIVPGESRKEEEITEEDDEAENIFADTEDEQSTIETDDADKEESLDDIFNEFNTEDSQVDFKQIDEPHLEDSKSDEDNIEDTNAALGIDEFEKDAELDEEHDPEVLALDSEDTNEDEELAKLDEFDTAETIKDEDTDELDALFEKAEEEISSIEEGDRTEGVLSDLETDLEKLDDDFDISKEEFEIEHPDFEKEGIETLSANIEEVDESDIEEESDQDELAAETNIDDENIDDEIMKEAAIIGDSDSPDETNEEDEKKLASSLDDNEYSKLSSSDASAKGGLGNGFWISVIVFIVVVVVGAYLYLFVYDSEDKSETIAENEVVEQPVNTNGQTEISANDAPPPEGAKVEQEPKEPVQQAVPQKREVVRIQGKGNKGLYRDGAGERLVSNRIFENNGTYSVQVSSFKTQSVAEKDARRLQKLGHDAFIVKAFVAKLNADYYRVRVGYFNTQKQAEEFSASLKR